MSDLVSSEEKRFAKMVALASHLLSMCPPPFSSWQGQLQFRGNVGGEQIRGGKEQSGRRGEGLGRRYVPEVGITTFSSSEKSESPFCSRSLASFAARLAAAFCLFFRRWRLGVTLATMGGGSDIFSSFLSSQQLPKGPTRRSKRFVHEL